MSYGHCGEGQQSRYSASGYKSSNVSSSEPQSPEWTNVTDPVERRKIQNKLAQQRFSECSLSIMDQQVTNRVQEPRPENNEKTQHARQRTIDRQRVPTLLQKQLNWKITTISQASRGEGYRSNISWQQDRTKDVAHSKARGRTLSTLCDREGVAGEDPA